MRIRYRIFFWKNFKEIFKKVSTYFDKYGIIYTVKERRIRAMDNITKALQDLAKAVESNKTVKSVKVTITLQKPNSSKATDESK